MKKFLIVLLVLLMLPLFSAMAAKKNSSVNELFLITNDSVNIAINHYKTGHDTVLIIAPGWFMTKDSKAFREISEDFSAYYDVISLDFRGHEKSGGYFTFTAKEPEDLNAVIKYAKSQYKNIYLMGFSLGGATSTICASKDKDIKKVILVSAPVSFEKIENEMWKKEAYIPTLQKFELKRWCTIRPGKFWLKKESPIDDISKVAPRPIFIIAGENDPTVHPWHAEELYKKASEPKKLVIIKNANHAEDIYLKDKKYFVETCTKWLDKNDILEK